MTQSKIYLKCTNRIKAESRLLNFTIDERLEKLTYEENHCIYECSGRNENCESYSPLGELKGFHIEKVVRL